MTASQQLGAQFLEYFNGRQLDELLALLDEDVTYNGRHGEGEGLHLLQEWVQRATTTMSPRRWFTNDDLAVAEIDVEWVSPRTGNVTDRATWAISFASADDHIQAISRFPNADEAVIKLGLRTNLEATQDAV